MYKFPLYRGDRILVATLALAVLTILALFMALSFFNYPSADDFCYAAKARDLGFLGAQAYWYEQWSGRYTLNLIWTALMLSGDVFQIYRFPPILLLVSTAFAFSFLVAKIGQQHLSPGCSLLVGGILSVLFISGAPDPAQTFYWLGGSLTYQLPNVLLLILLGLLAWRETTADSWQAQIRILIFASLLVIIIVGANEISLLLTGVTLFCGATYALLMRRNTRMFWLALLTIATGAALISVLAPGNYQRLLNEQGGQLRPDPWLAALLYLPWVGLRILYWLSHLGVWASAFLVLAITLPHAQTGFYADGKYRRSLLWIPVLWILVILGLNAIGFLINGYPLPERAESVVYLLFLLGWYPSFVLLAHYLFGDAMRQLVATPHAVRGALILLLISLLGSPNIFEAYKDVYRGYRYDQEIRARILTLDAASTRGEKQITLDSLSRPPRTLFATDLATDPNNPRNQCLREYLGVRSVVLGPSPAVKNRD